MKSGEWLKKLERVAEQGHGHVDTFRAFCLLSSRSLMGGTSAEADYVQEAKRWKPEQITNMAQAFADLVAEMDDGEPYTDLLGDKYCEWASETSRKNRGEFFTPIPLAQCMAEMIVPQPEDFPADRPLHFCEPACGAGVFILAVARVLRMRGIPIQCVRWRANDINDVAADMTYLNTSLWGIPAEITVGNGLNLENPLRVVRNPFYFMAYGYRGGTVGESVETVVPELVTAGQYALEFAEASA